MKRDDRINHRGSSQTVKSDVSKDFATPHNRRATAPITLLTDFGTSDYFVGAVKGVILAINPAIPIVDITHDVSPQDIEAAAFTLLAGYRSFASGTIHVVVVDPGVGSSRRPILACAAGQFFIGPDNGVFSYLLETEPQHKVFHITADKYFRQPLSSTFHGRDVFAPVAAALSTGAPLESFGPEIHDEVRLVSLKPEILSNENVKGRIIHVDRFGNCVTSIDRGVLRDAVWERATLTLKGKKIRTFREFYGAGKLDHEPFAIWGSAGFLEIAVQNRSASKVLKAKRGDKVTLKFW